MRIQKLLMSVATGCLLLGASGVAMAADSTCEGNYILNEKVDNLTVDEQKCIILGSLVNGNITVTNSPRFFIQDSRVMGKINISGGEDSGIVDTIVANKNITIKNGVDILVSNVTNNSGRAKANLVIKNNKEGSEVLIYNNAIGGSIKCANNTGGVLSLGNIVGGTIDCPLQ